MFMYIFIGFDFDADNFVLVIENVQKELDQFGLRM